jgi:methionyl-tRNA formyltransferase
VSNRADQLRTPRRITVVVDNDSWILPFAERLVELVLARGDKAIVAREHDTIPNGDAAFYLGCIKITPQIVLARNRRNLVVHASDLPRGRGFSPLTWLVIEGSNTIPVCLLEAIAEVDAGPVIYRDKLEFGGHELIDEMRNLLGNKSVELCLRFLSEPEPPSGTPQCGEPTYYGRKRPADSRLDPDRSIASQFDLLRVVDNTNYPAFFYYRGHRYTLKIEKMDKVAQTRQALEH